MTRTYLDFDLQIDELEATTFRARVLNSPAGQAQAIFDFPFSEQELEIFFLRIGRPRRGVRRINSPEMNEARKFGSKLYKTVFQDALQACLLRSIDKAEQQEIGLRLRLRLPPSLMDLPWEYLYDAAQDRFLCHSTSTPIVRYLELARPIKPLAVTPPLKVLVMIASPSDYEALDVEAEWRKIESALAELQQRGLIELTRLPEASLGALQRQLRRQAYHVFHFVGHGGFDVQNQDGVLLLEDENKRSRRVSGNQLGTLLHDHASLRLALLNACEGARTSRSDPFAGVAQQLLRQGIPAVIAMQFEITDKAAIVLATEFYRSLADGYSVDAALAEARKAIFAAENDIEWGTPVLYSRSQDCNFFDIARTSVATSQPASFELPKVEKQRKRRQVQPKVRKETSDVAPDPLSMMDKPALDEAKSDVQQETTPENLPADGETEIGLSVDFATQVAEPVTTPISSEMGSAQFENQQTKAPTREKIAVPIITKLEAPPIEFDWVTIPAGEFLMGSDIQKDPNAQNDELPQHLVYLSEYAIARVLVTNAQYKSFIAATYYTKPTHWTNGEIPRWLENHPVILISWQDAVEFCQWAKVRLPTEAEWEKAARGTDGRIYPWGNELPTDTHANFDAKRSGLQGFFGRFRAKGTTPVGKYPCGASPYGLLDMAGNVWERVADRYDAGYYKNSPRENPTGPATGKSHVIRGGSYWNGYGDVRASRRSNWYDNGKWDGNVGFRVVRVVPSGS